MFSLVGDAVELTPFQNRSSRRRRTRGFMVQGNKSCEFGSLQDEYVCVCVFIKLHMTAQSGLVILVILCHSR